ncbi:MAG: polysaccharide biosynthesis protein, partial [Thermoanaerobaculia bacterium]
MSTKPADLRSWWKPAPHLRAAVRLLQVVLDLVTLTAAFAAAYLLRFDFQVPPERLSDAVHQLPWVVLVQFAALALVGVYSFIWRYIGLAEIKAFLYAAAGSVVPFFILRFGLVEGPQQWRIPVSIIVVDTILAFGGVLALRILRRTLYEFQEKRQRTSHGANGERKAALLVGAGRAGVLAAREILGRPDLELVMKGFVDDDVRKQGAVIHGFRVLGTTEDLPQLVQELQIKQVVVTIARISRQDILRIIDICHKIPVKLRVMPGLYEILQGKVEVTRIRSVHIEDLLGREPVYLDEAQVGRFLAGRALMVTGAGGSIGSELARQVARFSPSKLLLVERAEFALFEIDQELRHAHPHLEIVPLPADVGEEMRIRSIFMTHRPQVVLHAAAHKHLPMMESHPGEAIENNVLATHLLGQLAGEYGAETFVLISTDKAVRPTSVMGASKRVAELVTQHLGRLYPTRYVAVRFGNVIGSAGSVVPIFREQIRRGGPVTVTHPDMRRYFMTIPEASQLVLQAGAMGEGGEIFILDMG